MVALIFCLFIVQGVSAQTATPTPQPPSATPFYCPTQSAPTSVTYRQKTLNVAPSLLRAYYPFDERAGTYAIDQSGNGYHATYSGVTLNSRLFANGTDPSPSWDNVNDHVVIPTGVVSNFAAGSISAWIYLSSSDLANNEYDRWINMQGSDWTFLIYDDGANNRVSIRYLGGNSQQVNVTPVANAWNYYVATWNALGFTVYHNGALAAPPLSIVPRSAASTPFLVGSGGGTQFAPGNIAHLSIWSDVLTAGQIASLYDTSTIQPTPTPPPGCIAASPTPTPTRTPTPTPDFWRVWTLPAITTATGTPGTPMPGQAVAVAYTFTAGEISVTLVVLILLLWIVIFTVVARLRGR